ncbi:hypothetical protein AWI43_25155 [Streptomyces sp. WAC04657]|nr:hypothetical protein AWI43_25155 [Streptomyces sp. WAC04657]
MQVTSYRIGTATAHRYVTEAVGFLAALTPGPTDAVRTASAKACPVPDGTLLAIDRIAADRLFHSGKHKKHGMNVQVVATLESWQLLRKPQCSTTRTTSLVQAVLTLRPTSSK